MDSKKIAALLTSVEKGSLTAAASDLGYTQSGLTHMMNALEDELGLNLLVRNKNGVHLSPAGQALHPYMRTLVDASDALEQEAERLRQRNYSTLRLGAYSSVAASWLPLILAEFRRVDPDIDVTIEVGGILDIYNKIKSDQLDCAIVSYHEPLCQGLSYVMLREDPLVAVLPEDYPLTESAFPVKLFAESEFLMPSFGFDMDINPLLTKSLGKNVARIRYTNLSDDAIVSMVAHNLGVSILSELIMQNISNSVRVLPLDPPASRKLGIAMSERQQYDKNIKRFIRCAKSVLAEIYKEEKNTAAV